MPGSPASEFQSYLFFLFHFRQLIWRGRGNAKPELLEQLAATQAPLLTRMPPRALSDQDRAAIRKYVFTAWNSEAVARLPAGFDPEVSTIHQSMEASSGVLRNLLSSCLATFCYQRNGFEKSRAHAPVRHFDHPSLLSATLVSAT